MVTIRNARELLERARGTLDTAMRLAIGALIVAGAALVVSLIALARGRG